MSSAEDAVPLAQFEPVTAARLSRALLAAIVVLASAGTGYVGSRLWPLSAFSSPATHLAATGNAGSTESASRAGAALSSTPASKADAAAPSPSQPAAKAKARIEGRGAATSSPGSSVTALYRPP